MNKKDKRAKQLAVVQGKSTEDLISDANGILVDGSTVNDTLAEEPENWANAEWWDKNRSRLAPDELGKVDRWLAMRKEEKEVQKEEKGKWYYGTDGTWDSENLKWVKKESKTTATTYPLQEEKCRHEAHGVFVLDDVTYFGGSESKVKGVPFPGLTVCLLGKAWNKDVFTGDPKWVALVKDHTTEGERLEIDWPDMKAPPLAYTFWRVLHAELKKVEQKNALFYCIGGHGRTGTALAAMLIANAGYTVPAAVKWVREHNCKKSIETEEQMDYLRALDKYFNTPKTESSKPTKN